MMAGLFAFTPYSVLGYSNSLEMSYPKRDHDPNQLPAAPTPTAELHSVPSQNGVEIQPQIYFALTIKNCVPWMLCSQVPQIYFVANEEIDTLKVTQVNLRIGNIEKSYQGIDALLTLPETGEQGTWIEYWADSDDQKVKSDRKMIKYRYIKSDPEGAQYQFDLIGPEWSDQIPSGSMVWGVFPPLTEPLPKALEQPFSANYLFTTNRYIFLAGNLIRTGQSRANHCPNNGVEMNGSANPCGEKASADQVLEWQNKFDTKIYTAAHKYNIPARILKGILAQESQFWPVKENPYELGLGQFTANGADLVLMWNTPYYLQVCIPLYGENRCASGFSNFEPEEKMYLRNSVIQKIDTDEELDLLAATILASAHQVGQMVRNTSGNEPANLTNYEVMWKMTTGNYHSGSGCLGSALQRINDASLQLTWEQVISQMDGECKISSEYVEKVFGATE